MQAQDGPDKNSSSTKFLGSILLIVGWLIALGLVGFLYQKFMYSSKEAEFQILTDTVKITITRQLDGHFWLPASIHGEKINFLIDTGATSTAIAEPIAKKIGLKLSYPIRVSTANGEVDAYLAKIDTIDFDVIQLFNVSVIILPNMQTDGLLGMNLLKKFSIVQDANKMELTFRRNSDTNG